MSRLVVVLVVVCIALATAGAAAAHATLVATTPGNGASLDRAPTRVVLRFDEPVETVSVAVRVFTAAGGPVPVDDARKLTDREVAADLPPDLAPGTYTVAWRVVSVDSHPLRGAFVFAVGQPAGEVADVVQESLAAEDDSGGLGAAQTIARFTALALVLLCVGGPALLLGGRHAPHLVRTTWRVVAFNVGHGCEGSPTRQLSVQVPAGVIGAKPRPKAGWKVTTNGAGVISWSGGFLRDGKQDTFEVRVKLPGTVGRTVYFPVVQRCVRGVRRWIQIPAKGQPRPERPAPGVLLTKATDAA